jgi:mannose-6-phosphate isomerase-like protein (cupin superfamily)
MTSETQTKPWVGNWTATDPLKIDFSWMGHDDGIWEPNADLGLEYRDLGLTAASNGLLSVHQARKLSAVDVSSAWRVLDCDFYLLFILMGSTRFEEADGTELELLAGDSVCRPKHDRFRQLSASADFESIEIAAPATSTLTPREVSGPMSDDSTPSRSKGTLSRETTREYVTGAGPRSYFSYRDLRTRSMTEDRIHVHVVRAVVPQEGGTGMHHHSMCQWFLVISGTGVIRVENQPDRVIVPGDCMCLAAGLKHDVASYSSDYGVLEMCIPADYSTTAD